ncbi:hypothetical protein F5Y08DRAFT_304556 [Xylaria arbuscula]|nr:hypothetical protein F5Y08DRAFT_304556 [Xylaria arbuscula]
MANREMYFASQTYLVWLIIVAVFGGFFLPKIPNEGAKFVWLAFIIILWIPMLLALIHLRSRRKRSGVMVHYPIDPPVVQRERRHRTNKTTKRGMRPRK